MKKKIGIIGFGRFGQFISKFLKKDFDVYVSSRTDRSKKAKSLGVKFVDLKEACQKDILILSVSISSLKTILKKIKKHIKKETLVLDVCSVKEMPCKLMKNMLKHNEILGTHPLFGPDSVKKLLKGNKIILCPVRIKKNTLTKTKKHLKSLGLIVIETTPKNHDKQIAKTLCLVQFIGRTLLSLKLKEEKIDTLGYKRLLGILKTVRNDSSQLFYDMNHFNKQSKQIRNNFIKSSIKINKGLK